MKTGIIIPADGSPARIETQEWNLDALQKTVGGWIEVVHVDRVLTDAGRKAVNVDMIINEEGKLIDLPTNPRATDFAALTIGGWVHDVIKGDVILLGGPDDEGEMTSIPETAIRIVKKFGWLK